MCPGTAGPKDELNAFVDVAAQHIAARLNSIAPGASLNPRDVYAIMHLCPFDTIVKERLSPFCSLFSEEDFEIYEYAGDLEKFYNTGCAPCLPITGALLIVHLIATGVPWEPFRASDTSTSSSGVSRIPPRTTACKPTAPYFPHLKLFH